jgi:hypothetical protein
MQDRIALICTIDESIKDCRLKKPPVDTSINPKLICRTHPPSTMAPNTYQSMITGEADVKTASKWRVIFWEMVVRSLLHDLVPLSSSPAKGKLKVGWVDSLSFERL